MIKQSCPRTLSLKKFKVMIELEKSRDGAREKCQRSRLTKEYFEPL